MADRNGSALRRLLRSAERLSERATARGSAFMKTPCSRSSALLVLVTRLDHRLARGLVLRGMPEKKANRVRYRFIQSSS